MRWSFAEIGDAALRHDEDHKCHRAWLIAGTTAASLVGDIAPWSILAWSAHTIQRVVNSSLAAKVSVQVEGIGVLTWVRALWESMLDHHYTLADWKATIDRKLSVAITDCKSLFDRVTSYKGVTTSCKRTGIYLAILKNKTLPPPRDQRIKCVGSPPSR